MVKSWVSGKYAFWKIRFGCLENTLKNIAGPKGDLRSKPLSVIGLHDFMAEFWGWSNLGCLENTLKSKYWSIIELDDLIAEFGRRSNLGCLENTGPARRAS